MVKPPLPPGPGPSSSQAEIQSWVSQGVALHRQGRLAEAKAIYEAILQQDAKHFDGLNLLGTVALQSGDFGTAVDLIGRAITQNPTVAMAHYHRAMALEKLARLPEALAGYDSALALKPSPEAYYNRGNVLRTL